MGMCTAVIEVSDYCHPRETLNKVSSCTDRRYSEPGRER